MKIKLEIEPKIKPLVHALNETGILSTFSSCQGHFTRKEQEHQDRNHADVRFYPEESASVFEIESFLTYMLKEFNRRHSFDPVSISSYKMYTPLGDKDEIDFVYIVELSPFNRFDLPVKKRAEIDTAIIQATEIVRVWNQNRNYENL